jgi:hypothetical protein
MPIIISVTRKRKGTAPRLSRLPNLTAPLVRLNGLCPYYTMFPLSFPFNALAAANGGEWVLDPFCGRGTTIFAARLRGLPSVGVDSNPVAGAIAAAKLAMVRASEVTALARKILEDRRLGPVPAIPQGEFWGMCYTPKTLRDICRIRNYLLAKCSNHVEIALRGVMLGILHGPRNKGKPTYLSNQMPRTYSTKPGPAVRYWRKNNLKPSEIDVLDAIDRRARFSFEQIPPPTLGKIVTADSRTFDFTLLPPRYSWVITSPPYYGMRTYFPDQWLRNWFLGGPASVSYSTEQQVPHSSENDFVAGLSKVWRRVAAACVPGARLIVRFGALPSVSKDDPKVLLARSLREADCGWRITTVKNAGTAQKGRRQYEQFGPSESEPVEEIDLYARLEE